MVAQSDEKPELVLEQEMEPLNEAKEELPPPDDTLILVVPADAPEIPQLKQTGAKAFLMRYRGILFAFASSILMSFSHILVRKSIYLSGSEQSILRYLVQVVTMLIIIKREKVEFFGPPGQKKLLFVRGCAGTVGILSISFAVKFIAPSDAISLVHTNVIMTALFARLFLKEKLSLAHFISIIFTISGVILVSQPDFIFKAYKAGLKLNALMLANSTGSLNTTTAATELFSNMTSLNQTISDKSSSIAALGIGLSLIGAAVAASVPILIKQLTNKKVHFAVVIIYASYVGMPAALIISFILHITGTDTKSQILLTDRSLLIPQLGYGFGAAIVGLLAQIAVNMAIKYEDTSKISIIRSSDVLFTFILQHFIVGLDSNIFSVIGAVLIVVGSVCVIMYQVFDKRYLKHLAKDASKQKNGELTGKSPGVVKRSKIASIQRLIFYKF